MRLGNFVLGGANKCLGQTCFKLKKNGAKCLQEI